MSTPNPAKKFFGHPIQLSTLFHIELWERFSFYGMQGILMIYLYYAAKEGGLGIDKTLAGGIVRSSPPPAHTAAASTSPPSSARGWPTGFLGRKKRCLSQASS